MRHPRRDRFQQKLAELGIGTLIHCAEPLYLCGAYADHRPPATDLWKPPIAEELAHFVLSLPIGPHSSEDQRMRVVASVKALVVTLTGS